MGRKVTPVCTQTTRVMGTWEACGWEEGHDGGNGQEAFEIKSCGFNSLLNPRHLRGNQEEEGRWRDLICEGTGRRENTVAGKSKEKHAIGWKERGEKHACNGSEEERQGWGHLCPPSPFPGHKSSSLSTATVAYPWYQKVSTPFLTRHLGSLFKVEGGERRKARAASGIPKHSLMKRLWHGGGRAALGWHGYPCGLGLSGGCHSHGGDGGAHLHPLHHRHCPQPWSVSAPACAWPLPMRT